MKIQIKSTVPEELFKKVNALLDAKYTLLNLQSYLRWSTWRYVKVYEATLEMEFHLSLSFGPFSERPIPDLPWREKE
jgi:hypothetical protein